MIHLLCLLASHEASHKKDIAYHIRYAVNLGKSALSKVQAGLEALLNVAMDAGWGLDEEGLIEEAVKVMHQHLKPQGILVVGHNRGRGNCCSFGPLFTPHAFGGLPEKHEDPLSETKHVFEFYIKNSNY